MFIALQRIIRAGFHNFQRNLWMVFATMGIMSITLFIVSSLTLFNFLTREVVGIIRNKIDLSVYFVVTVEEAEILKVRDLMKQLPEVSDIQYVSREEAYAKFQQKHASNDVITKALEELGGNPLQASLNIKAETSDQYAVIFNFLETAPFRESISKVNFTENKLVIERLNKIIRAIQGGGLGIILVFAGLAILVAFNSIRMAIYSFREEINIMKLVGASKWFVRGPFFVMGAMISSLSALLVFGILWAGIAVASPRLANFLPEISLYGFFSQQWFIVFLIEFLAGLAVMSVSTYLATSKYLKEN
ncbi:MAG: Cell division protein FtsX [Parcubacteria group bacterium GW2011_GWB1_46_8]|nr:MAG: Cell division protein FtsX [Parcubacteria group bacterium GW2011_GWF1_45_5]KKU44196.1 MAG: Cell division protein FtsX [Parcubacteria group bacterium GW2011_GWA2_46_7]KKU46620.1 MAG: Cell division protein FtsX [Parcubacteria group bacterium GW2011_GWB1_46_8]